MPAERLSRYAKNYHRDRLAIRRVGKHDGERSCADSRGTVTSIRVRRTGPDIVFPRRLHLASTNPKAAAKVLDDIQISLQINAHGAPETFLQ